MNASKQCVRRSVVWCGAMVLSLVLAVPANATVIDDFTSNTLDSHWVQSPVLSIGSGGDPYVIDTTTNDNQLTIARGSNVNAVQQEVLLRSDFSIGVGQTLSVDLTSPMLDADSSGLYITTATGVTSRKDAIYLSWFQGGSTVRSVYFDHAGNDYGASLGLASAPAKLLINRTDASTYAVGYDAGAGPVTVATWAIGGANLDPGTAIGFLADYRGAGTSSFDNVQITNAVPEPSAMVVAVTGLIGLLAYAWRKQR